MSSLRERLKALVEEWREEEQGEAAHGYPIKASVYLQCADQLAAILAESEPVDWSQPHDLVVTVTHSPHPPGDCADCADDEVRREREAVPKP